MSSTVVDICNQALSMAGARATIASLTEDSEEARACNIVYDTQRKSCLRAAHWNFARFQANLGLLLDASKSPPDNVPAPWVYEYAYPTDCLMARYVMPIYSGGPATYPGMMTEPPMEPNPVKFMVANDNDASGNPITVILTNQYQALMVYTRDISNTLLFDPSFVDALAAAVASRVCLSLTGNKGLSDSLYQVADAITKNARARNGNESITVVNHIPDWIRVRGYTMDWAAPAGYYTMAPMDLIA